MKSNAQLSKAIALALTGTALSIGGISTASAGSTGYNAFNHDRPDVNVIVGGNGSTPPGGNGTDGWLVTTGQNPDPLGATPGSTYTTPGHSYGDGPTGGNNLASGGAVVPWVGLNPYTSFGFAPAYAANQNRLYPTLNWVGELTSANDSVTISRIDSNTRYAGTALADGTTFNFADIDTAKGAWHDGGATNPLAPTGWKHDTDLGLFRSTVTQDVTLNIASLLGTGEVDETPNYGITVFKSINGGTAGNGAYNHHGGWHTVSNAAAIGAQGSGLEAIGTDITAANPFGGSGMLITTRVLDDVLNNNATFTAEAGAIYTIMLGGFQGGEWTSTRNNYQLTISSSPVPVPAAVWLFGGGLASLIGAARRKRGNVG
jgi:hypothetical protein